MLALLRAIARTTAYRAHHSQLAAQQPDDVWYETDYGWMVAFTLDDSPTQQLLLFVLQEQPGSVPTVTSIRKVTRELEGNRVISEVISIAH